MNLTTSYHAMSPSQSPSIQPHFINLNQFEMSIIQSIKQETENLGGPWSCKLCNTQFIDIMRLVTHLLTFCDRHRSLSTFLNVSAIHICMLLDDSGSIKTLETYIRLAGNDTDSEVSDLGNDTDSEASTLSNDTNSDASDLAEPIMREAMSPGMLARVVLGLCGLPVTRKRKVSGPRARTREALSSWMRILLLRHTMRM
ncbi:hypothetical protein HO173_009972 [Letharia columbiana]|uniref:C2H2-type domain-containing protein n=1 Tax=Letharia columbiana TaxID=112416 RepID=A0A8H6FNQ8_9LECA|nr:uncharacterized protein HO173_009972 [Letharia columbiana]KAF6231889.1 hypothetical protein HO173_009972 [Letharia columbiana]